MRRARFWTRSAPAALLVAAAALAPIAAQACSVGADYRVPSNLELAAGANTIVLGQVVRELPATGQGIDQGSALEVRPLGAIKGLVPGEMLVLQGMELRPAYETRAAEASDPLDFAAPHQDALTGACIRRVLPAGTTILFFLQRSDGGWRPAGGPFSRWAEDVSGPGDPWAQLATLYARAAQIGSAERAALLQDQLEALQARSDDPVALAMAADIERAMSAPGFPRLPEAPAPAPLPAFVPEEPAAQAAEPAAADDLGELGARIDALQRN